MVDYIWQSCVNKKSDKQKGSKYTVLQGMIELQIIWWTLDNKDPDKHDDNACLGRTFMVTKW